MVGNFNILLKILNEHLLSPIITRSQQVYTLRCINTLIFLFILFIKNACLFIYSFIYLFLDIYRERERQSMSGGEVQKETETQNWKQDPGSELSAQSPMPKTRLQLTNREIMT